MRADQFNARIAALIRSMGTPYFQHFYPLAPVPRIAGVPKFISRKRAEEGDKKAQAWLRRYEFREEVRRMTKEAYTDEPLTGAVFAFMEFYIARPKSQKKTNLPILVQSTPDAKNYMWAMEDALNPKFETIRGVGRRMMVWPGLWHDDALVTTFPIRRYADTPEEVGIRLSAWKIDNAAAS